MKIGTYILSDLHSNFWENCDFSNKEEIFSRLDIEDVPVDLIILAGDVSECSSQDQEKYIQVIRAICSIGAPVILVKGNHENYRTTLTDSKFFLKLLQTELFSNLHFLENEYVDLVIKGNKVRIFGCTLWTDFDKENPMAMLDAKMKMNDFGQMILKPGFSKFLPEDALREHQISLHKLYAASDSCPKDSEFIVVTHHSPILQASTNFRKLRNFGNKIELLDFSYASDLTEFIESLSRKPSYWIFGHIHAPFKENYLGINFIANPYGYPVKYEKRIYDDPYNELEFKERK